MKPAVKTAPIKTGPTMKQGGIRRTRRTRPQRSSLSSLERGYRVGAFGEPARFAVQQLGWRQGGRSFHCPNYRQCYDEEQGAAHDKH